VQSGTVGPVIMLLHGFPQHAHAWRHVITELAADHQVYAVDLRGAGASDAPPRGYDTATRVADVLAILDELNLSTVHLAGHEWGGWLAFHVALRAPARVSSLAAINAPHPWVPLSRMLPQMWRVWYTALLEYPALGSWILQHRPGLTRWLLRRGRPHVSAQDLAIYVQPNSEPARARAGQQLHWQFVRRDIPARLLGRLRHSSLRMPTVALYSTRDFALSRRCAVPALPQAPSMRVLMVNGGHWLPEEQPSAVATIIRDLAGSELQHEPSYIDD
jgi:pimeloyl-ACP methyl ester carboxylesterase